MYSSLLVSKLRWLCKQVEIVDWSKSSSEILTKKLNDNGDISDFCHFSLFSASFQSISVRFSHSCPPVFIHYLTFPYLSQECSISVLIILFFSGKATRLPCECISLVNSGPGIEINDNCPNGEWEQLLKLHKYATVAWF